MKLARAVALGSVCFLAIAPIVVPLVMVGTFIGVVEFFEQQQGA